MHVRIVFCTMPSYSHFFPILFPLARAAKEAGHEVAVATSAELAEDINKAGLETLALPNVLSMEQMMQRPEMVAALPIDPSLMAQMMGKKTINTPASQFAEMFVSMFAEPFAHDLMDVLPTWKPDLIVRECAEYGSYYAAEALGLKHVAVDIAPMGEHDSPEVLKRMNAGRTALGLDEVDSSLHQFARGRLCVIPELYYPAEKRLPSARYYRAGLPVESGTLDPEIAALPGDRPLVLATLGSNAGRMLSEDRSVLHTIVEVLGDLPVTGVVALGQNHAPENWNGARPDNVHLTSFVQQQLLLPNCDAFITHGGFNGTREALTAGVPMVTIPLFAEQPQNAKRVQELGAGRRLYAEDVTHESLTTAVRAVVEEPSYRNKAGQIQRQLLGLPGFDQLVRDLETFAR